MNFSGNSKDIDTQMNWQADQFHPEKYAGKYEPVKYGVMTPQKDKYAAQDLGSKRKREWAVRALLGAVQSGELTSASDILREASILGVNDDPQVASLYAAAKNKPQTPAQPAGNEPDKSALIAGLDKYMQTPEGKSDSQVASVLKGSLSGQIPQDQFTSFINDNAAEYAAFAQRLATFAKGGKGLQTGEEMPPLQKTGEEFQPESSSSSQGPVANPYKVPEPPRTEPQEQFPINAGMLNLIRPSAQAPASAPEHTAEQKLQQHLDDLEKQRGEIYSDFTRFNSAIDQQRLKDINTELSKYEKPSSVYEMKKMDANAARGTMIEAIDAEVKDGIITETTAASWKRIANSGNYQNIQEINKKIVDAGYMPQRDAEEISNAIKKGYATIPGEVAGELAKKNAIRENEITNQTNNPILTTAQQTALDDSYQAIKSLNVLKDKIESGKINYFDLTALGQFTNPEVANAQRQLVEVYGRKRSGAQINAGEWTNFSKEILNKNFLVTPAGRQTALDNINTFIDKYMVAGQSVAGDVGWFDSYKNRTKPKSGGVRGNTSPNPNFKPTGKTVTF